MRRSLILMIAWGLFSGAASVAMATEALWGRVVSVDRQKGIMVLATSEETPPITVRFSPEALPRSAREGTPMRVWGEFDPKEANLFHATAIRGGGWWGGSDPTGVRQRIGGGGWGRGGGFGGRGRGRGR
jgi:hypothetical protein